MLSYSVQTNSLDLRRQFTEGRAFVDGARCRAAELSSGGFSDRWPRAAWQSEAVANYVSQLGSQVAPTRYNHTGAGFPDISAQVQPLSSH